MEGNKLFIPLSIVVAGLVVAGAIVFSNNGGDTTAPTDNNGDTAVEQPEIAPITEEDHILGNPDAEIVIVEHSDYECPFCARFHPTMERIMSEYGDSGQVAWVYRHFPLDQIHPDARPAAEASECVAALGGNSAFWDYTKKLFDGTPASLSPENLRANAEAVGVNGDEFQACFDEGRFADKVEAQYQSGLAFAQSDPNFGTPYSVAVTKDGTQVVIPGAQPYDVVKQVIDTLLAEGE